MGEATEDATVPGKPRRFRGLKIVTVLLAGTVIAGWFLTATASGLGLLTRLAAPLVESATGYRLAVDSPNGSLWSRFSARKIGISGPDGLALDIVSPVLDWRPVDLFSSRVTIRELAASRVEITLSTWSEPVEENAEPFALPQLPAIGIRLAKLDFPDITIRLPENDVPLQLAATGGLNHRADGVTEARMDIRPVGSGSDAVTFDAALDTERQTLDLKAEALMAQDGVFAKISGLEGILVEPLSLSVTGDGPLDRWRGNLRFAYGQLVTWQTGFAGAINAAPFVALDGEINLGDPAAFGLPAGLAGAYRNRMDIALSEAGDLTVRNLDLALPGMVDLSGEVSYGTDGALSGNLDLRATEAMAGALDAGIGFAELFLSAGISGTVDSPALEIAASVKQLDIPDLLRADAALDGHLTISADGRLATDIDTELSDVAWQVPDADSLLGKTLRAQVAVEADAPYQQFVISGLTVDAGTVSLRGSGEAGADGGLSGIELVLAIPDIAILRQLAGIDLAGSADIRLTGFGGSMERGFAGDLAISGTAVSAGDAMLDRLVGTPTLRSPLRIGADQHVRLPGLRLVTAAASVTGEIGYRLADGTLEATLAGAVTSSALPPVEGIVLKSDPAFRISLAGPAERPTGTVTVELAGADAAGIAIGKTRLDARLNWRQADPAIAIDLRSLVAGLDLRTRADLEAGRDLAIGDIRAELPGLALTGNLALPAGALPLTGSLELAVTDTAAISRFAGTPIVLRGDIQAGLKSVGGKQAADISGRLADIRLDDAGLAIASADIRLALSDLLGQPGLDARLEARKVSVDGASLETLTASAAGTLSELDWRLAGTGKAAGKPANIDLAGRVAQAGDRLRVAISSGTASFDGLKTGIADPLTVELADGAPVSASGTLSLAGGRVGASYRKTGKDATLEASASSVALAPLLAVAGQKNVTGTASFAISLTEKAGRTGGDLRLDLADIRTPALPVPAGLTLTGRLEGKRLIAEANMSGIDLDATSASAELPVEISLATPSVALPQDGAIRADVRFAGDIARIWPLLPLPEHQMSGRFDIDATASGTLANPSLGGTARITGGEYEHLEFGSRLTAIALEARFDGGRLTLQRLSAGDGASGTVSADGYADLADGNLDYRFHLAANGTRLVHRDDLEAVASADIRAEGNADGGRLAGTVTIEKAEINLAAALPPTVTTLEIENDPNRKEKDVEATSSYPLELDLQIAVPGKTFVRGRGLDSEWAGKIDIAGTAAEPSITGGIRAVRGQMDVVGKVFDIRDSAIGFSGGPEPRLDIAGQYKTKDLEVTARLTGPARKPELTLTSSPPLPRDEILAQVLFGQGKANLGPLQAAQLAAAAADLSGATGGGTDVIGRIRKLAGVDVLRVEDGATGPAVAAGKYIADGVYVGAKQGSKPGSGGVEVEVEVTPNISVKSEAGQTGDSNIGVQFKWDY